MNSFGCAYVPPNGSRQSPRKKSNNSKSDTIDGKHLFTKMWNKIDKQIETVRRESYAELMESLYDYIQIRLPSEQQKRNSDQFNCISNCGLIVTAVLNLGIHSIL